MQILKNKKFSFAFLNITQFLGALNDNIFKLIVIYFLINLEGARDAPTILAMAGAVFVIPFLLFSSASGVLADRISKQKIIVVMKAAEILIMAFGVFAILLKSPFLLYTLLFFMAFQSAVFGPSKYGIIPEIVETKYVSKANGYISAFTSLAIISGTFLASFITDITDKNFILETFFCVLIAIFGFVSSLGIIKTIPKRSKKKINPFFLYEIYKTFVICSRKRYLITAVLGSSFFLFIGGFTQLNTIPYAIQSLNLTEVGGGYIFLATAFGIALGSFLAGKISKDRVEPGLACLASFFVSGTFILLGLFSSFLSVVLILLAMLGFFGGFYLVPFDSFIQMSSPDKKRGRIVAATNFLSFVGVLIASAFLYLVSSILKFDAATGFIFMGIICFTFSLFITGRMSELFFSYIARKILLKIYKIKVFDIPTPNSYIIMINKSWLEVFLMFSFLPNLKVFTLGKVFRNFPFFRGFLNSLYLIKRRKSKRISLLRLYAKAHKHKRRINFVCLFIDNSFTEKDISTFLKSSHGHIYPEPVYLETQRHNKNITFRFTKTLDSKNY